MWLVRRKTYEAERQARVRAEMIVERQGEEICALETSRSHLLRKIKDLVDAKKEEEPLSLCFA